MPTREFMWEHLASPVLGETMSPLIIVVLRNDVWVLPSVRIKIEYEIRAHANTKRTISRGYS